MMTKRASRYGRKIRIFLVLVFRACLERLSKELIGDGHKIDSRFSVDQDGIESGGERTGAVVDRVVADQGAVAWRTGGGAGEVETGAIRFSRLSCTGCGDGGELVNDTESPQNVFESVVEVGEDMDGDSSVSQAVEGGNGVAEQMPRGCVRVVIEELVKPLADWLANLGGWVLGGLFEYAGGEFLPPQAFRMLAGWAGKVIGAYVAIGSPSIRKRAVEHRWIDGPLVLGRDGRVGFAHGL